MAKSALSPRKELEAAWMVLRFEVRSAAMEYAPGLVERTNAMSGEPPDPAQVEPLVMRLSEELQKEAGEGQASPTLRLVRRIFRPSDAERVRRNLRKAFNAYLGQWNSQSSASPS